MRKALMVLLLLGAMFIGFFINTPVRTFADSFWDTHILGGGLYNGTTGTPLKCAADGSLYIRTN